MTELLWTGELHTDVPLWLASPYITLPGVSTISALALLVAGWGLNRPGWERTG